MNMITQLLCHLPVLCTPTNYIVYRCVLSLSLSFSMIHLQVIAITCLYHPPSFGFSLLLLFVACFVATGWGGMDPGEQGKVEKMV